MGLDTMRLRWEMGVLYCSCEGSRDGNRVSDRCEACGTHWMGWSLRKCTQLGMLSTSYFPLYLVDVDASAILVVPLCYFIYIDGCFIG